MGIRRTLLRVLGALGSGRRRQAAPQQRIRGLEPSPADLMGACDSVVARLSSLFTEKGVRTAMDAEEMTAFAMAIVTQTYLLGQGGVAEATPVLDEFHADVEAMIVRRSLHRGNPALKEAVLNQVVNHFFELLRVRYPEYKKAFRLDALRGGHAWFNLSRLALDRIFAERLTQNQKGALLCPLALYIAIESVDTAALLLPSKEDYGHPYRVSYGRYARDEDGVQGVPELHAQ